MRAYDLKKSTAHSPLYCLTGTDEYWTSYALDVLLSPVPYEDRDFRTEIFDPCDDVTQAVSAVSSLSLTGEGRYVIVRGRSSRLSKAESQALTEYCSSPVKENCLIICDPKGVFSDVYDYAVSVACKPLEEADAREYVADYARGLGLAMNAEAARTLNDYCNGDPGRQIRELDKIAAYMPEDGIVTADLVKMLVAADMRAKAYELADALACGRKNQAADILSRLAASGVQNSYILRALQGTYRNLLHLRISPLPDADMSKLLATPPFAIRKLRALAGRYSAVTLKNVNDCLNNLEYSFKSGRISVDNALNLAICRLMGVTLNV